MNLQQLQYILAVDEHRHFANAAEACHVTQPTLSTMIHRLEEELEVKIFDRTRQPVVPTEIGEQLLIQARKILFESKRMKEICENSRNSLEGELRIGIIPTIAPYLLPLFLSEFTTNYPNIHLKVSEGTTDNLLEQLDNNYLDGLILVPVENKTDLKQTRLYTESFVVYTPKQYPKEYLLAEDIAMGDLLLLEEGHCFRSQILNFCELKESESTSFKYTGGSLEALRNLADIQLGITILPEMATLNFNQEQRRKLKFFADPKPLRTVSFLTKRDYLKARLIESLCKTIVACLPANFKDQKGQEIPLIL